MNANVVQAGNGPPSGSANQGESYYDYTANTRYVFQGSNWAVVTPIEDCVVVSSFDYDMSSHVEELSNM